MAKKESLQHGLCRMLDISNYKNNNTRKSAKRTIRQFSEWLKITMPGVDLGALSDHGMAAAVLQIYSDSLQVSDKSPATIHTMLAYPCKALNVGMAEIQKPRRSASAIRRGRSGAGAIDPEKHKRLLDFQSRVGIRRAELAKLTGQDWQQDEFGHWCVVVRRGKGGKMQLQRILPGDLATVSSYFGGSAERLFSDEELANKLNLHRVRAEQARRAYAYYEQQLQSPEAREKAIQELSARYRRYNRGSVDKWLSELSKTSGYYYLRGENRQKAAAAGRPVVYDRLALMMVSVFHLSHWRLDVTVTNYMIP